MGVKTAARTSILTISKYPPKAGKANSYRPKGGRPAAEESALRAEHLRVIATEVFIEFGYERANLTEMANRAGASKETIYAQYGDKCDLFLTVMSSHLQTVFTEFVVLMAEKEDIQKALEDFSLRLLTTMLGPYQSFVHLIVAESQRFPELARLFWERAHLGAYANLSCYLREQINRRRLANGDPDVMARQFLNLLTGDVIIQSLLNVQRSMSESRRKALANATTDAFLRIYRPQSEDGKRKLASTSYRRKSNS